MSAPARRTEAGAGPRGPAPASYSGLLRWLPLAPVLVAQGAWVRRRVPRLPEAAGPGAGWVPGAGAPIRLLVAGESTAAGVGVESHGDGLAARTAASLAALAGRGVEWRALGRSGATARMVLDELLPGLEGRWDAAVLALGVNDALRLSSPARWRQELRDLIDALRDRGVNALVIAAVPPLHRFPALPWPLRGVLGARARLLDATAAELALALDGVAHQPHPVLPPDCGALFCRDGFHPSAAGYAAWGEALAGAVLRLL